MGWGSGQGKEKKGLEEGKIKAWKLKDPIKRRMFDERVSDKIGANVDHAAISNALLNSTREVCEKIWWLNEYS